jgi:hypothetical protein
MCAARLVQERNFVDLLHVTVKAGDGGNGPTFPSHTEPAWAHAHTHRDTRACANTHTQTNVAPY